MARLAGRLFHVSCTVEGTWRLLKRHGWSWQQPDPLCTLLRERSRFGPQ
ncbi:winged helix-turn-helix domain-containing protein [Streptomyces collinus]